MDTPGDYVFDNAGDLAEAQLIHLQSCLDPITAGQLAALGVGAGWRCLEVGGGAGSMASWLGHQVGEAGNVLVTDLDPRLMADAMPANVTIRQHDIVHDELPEAAFDLAYARLVLLHLPARQQALARMISALRPGGWLLLHEFDCTWRSVLSGNAGDVALADRFYDALCHVLVQAGADLRWGLKAYSALRDAGLVDLDVGAQAHSWTGGSPGCRWLRINAQQLHEKLLASDLISGPELEIIGQRLTADPSFAVMSWLSVLTWGRRP